MPRWLFRIPVERVGSSTLGVVFAAPCDIDHIHIQMYISSSYKMGTVREFVPLLPFRKWCVYILYSIAMWHSPGGNKVVLQFVSNRDRLPGILNTTVRCPCPCNVHSSARCARFRRMISN
eukprot:m.365498 g.365498  ORF g.365498 m.365498 type:complete len:120 (+) comp20815_c0_seq23:761-1120(+)